MGEPSILLCGRHRSMPADRPRQPRTNKRKCGIQPAHQSLLTVVSAALPPALRNSYRLRHPAPSCGHAASRPTALTTNIRARCRIDASQHRRGTLEELVVQAHPNAGQVLALVDRARLPCCRLEIAASDKMLFVRNPNGERRILRCFFHEYDAPRIPVEQHVVSGLAYSYPRFPSTRIVWKTFGGFPRVSCFLPGFAASCKKVAVGHRAIGLGRSGRANLALIPLLKTVARVIAQASH